jgi:PBP1b-binding outer membrane lipoprotein LpoB
MGMGMMRPGMMMQGTPEMVDARLAELKAELAITDEQADAWTAYAAAVKNRANSMQGMHANMMQTMQTGTAVDRLDAHIAHMRVMMDALTALKPATEGLYKVLTDEQRKKADSLIGTGCGFM